MYLARVLFRVIVAALSFASPQKVATNQNNVAESGATMETPK
jgi:hypothetical protein